MDYEKKYKEALERARQFSEHPLQEDSSNIVEYIFPELRESENERTRKEIISFLQLPHKQFVGERKQEKWIAWLEKQKEPLDKGEISDGYHTFNELYYYRMLYNAAFFNLLPKEWVHKSKKHHTGEECFGGGWFIVMANLPTGQISNHYELKDWDLFQIPEKEVADKWDGHTPQEAADRLHKYLLEKQGKQKPVDMIESKFHEGDWVILTAGELSTTLQIVNVDAYKKRYWFNDNSYLPIVDEECLHLWTIQDAKDGDVLCCESGWTCVFKALDNHANTFSSYCFMDNDKWFCNTGSECHTLDKAFIKAYNGEIHPATKEQRDTLLKAMTDAGYEWDAEKKELKTVEKKPQRVVSAEAKEALYDKPTDNDMVEALRMEYEKGRADVLRCIDPDEMVADFCSQPLSMTRSLASIYRQGIIDVVKRINNNEKTSITGTHSIDDVGL